MQDRSVFQKLDMIVTAIKANTVCKAERQNFSIIYSTVLGRYIEPQIAIQPATALIDCYQNLYNSPAERVIRKPVMECLIDQKDCTEEINKYVQAA